MNSMKRAKGGFGGAVLRASMGIVALSILTSCKWGGTDDCPQCNSHCRVSVWPRLILGLTDGAAGPGATPLTVRMTTEGYASAFGTGVDSGLPDHCYCLDHLTDITCSQAYVLGPDQRDVTFDISRGDALLGSCQVHLPEHNYCGFDATVFEVSVTGQQQVLCGSRRTLDICPR